MSENSFYTGRFLHSTLYICGWCEKPSEQQWKGKKAHSENCVKTAAQQQQLVKNTQRIKVLRTKTTVVCTICAVFDVYKVMRLRAFLHSFVAINYPRMYFVSFQVLFSLKIHSSSLSRIPWAIHHITLFLLFLRFFPFHFSSPFVFKTKIVFFLF